jgi:hypothetical protein
MNFFFSKVKICENKVFGVSNFISIAKKCIKIITNLTFRIKFKMRNDGHFGQLRIFSKKIYIIAWMERVTFHGVPRLFLKNSSNTN